ncbi:MAG: metallophosphoesterase family protein [Clostridia bacterium]
MKILVFSDSHNHAYRIEKIVHNETDIDLIIHLGDCISDIQTIQKLYPQYSYEYVPGNCDYAYTIPEEKTIELGGLKFFLTHSAKYNTNKNLYELYKNTENLGVDVVLYGHTHEPSETVHKNILYMNPGCLSRPRNKGLKTYLVLTIEDGKMNARFVPVENLKP